MIPPSTRLRRAIEVRSLPLVRRILRAHPHDDLLLRNPDYSDSSITSLHLCAVHGLPEIASFLLSLGHEDAGISRTTSGLTPLMLAAQAGPDEEISLVSNRIAVGRMLIEQFPKHVTIRDKSGMDAFAHAAASGTNSLITLLMSKPLEPYALSYLQDKILNVLPGAPDDEYEDDRNPLRFLWSKPATLPPPPPVPQELAQQLAALSSTSVHPLIMARDDNGNTPLHHASASGHLKTLRLLIANGADAQARNTFTWTAVDYSATVAAEVYLRQLVKEQLQRQGIATGRQSPVTGRSSPAERWGTNVSSPSAAFGSPGMSSPGTLGSPIAGRQSPVATAAQVAERAGAGTRMRGGSNEMMGRVRGGTGASIETSRTAGSSVEMSRMRGGSNETGRGSPVPTALAGRLRGESDEKRRPGVRLVQQSESESEESEEEVGIGRARTRT